MTKIGATQRKSWKVTGVPEEEKQRNRINTKKYDSEKFLKFKSHKKNLSHIFKENIDKHQNIF